MFKKYFIIIMIILISSTAFGSTIVGSKHDLESDWKDTNNPGWSVLMRETFNNYGEVCVYCHTPHSASTTINAPLWNKNFGGETFKVYNSSTMKTTPANPPDALSLACLSCHDGVSAVDSVINAPGSGTNLAGPWYGQSAAIHHFAMKEGANACGECHTGGGVAHDARATYLGTDLRNDHPISMLYPIGDPDFNTPPDPQNGWNNVKLFNGKVECESCHDPHNPANGEFLRMSNTNSALCYKCHNK